MIKLLCILFSITFVSSLNAQTSAWRLFSELGQSRSHFFATQISQNEILVVGGYSRGVALRSCEIINTETGAVIQADSMRFGRWLFAPVIVGDSLLFVFGGAQSDGLTPVEKVEVFDFRTRRWSDAGDLSRSRTQIVAAYDGDNSIIVVGGRIGNDAVADANIYHVDRRYSEEIQPFPYATSLGSAVGIPGGQMLFFGGRSGGPGSFRSRQIHAYNPVSRSFTYWGDQADSVYVALATKLSSGSIAVSGGSLVERSSNDNTLVHSVSVLEQGKEARVVGQLSQARILHHAIELQPNKVLIVGGELPSSSQTSSCELAVVDSGIVRPFPSLNIERSWFQLVSVKSSAVTRVFAIGGRIGGLLSPETTPTIEILEHCASVASIAPIGELAFNGDAKPEGSNTKLTGTKTFSAGSVWKPFVGSPTRDGFHHRIKARLANGDNRGENEQTSPGADGIVLVVQRHGVDALGASGRNIGYSGIRNGVAIEFDTYVNLTNADPPGHHLAVMKPVNHSLSAVHNEASTAAFTLNVPNIVSDSSPFYIDYHYLNRKLTVTVSKTNDFDNASLIVENFDIDALIGLNPGEPYFIGFTSATGVAVQEHIIDDWMEFSCMEPSKATSVNEPAAGYPITARSTPTLAITPSPASVFADVFLPVGQGAPTTLAVFDVQGREVLRMNLEGFTEVVQIPVANLAAGMYVVHVVTTTTTATGLLPVSR